MKLKHLQRLNIRDYFKNERMICVVKEMHAAPSNAYIAMHDHDFSEIAIVAEGALTHIHPGGSVRLTAGDFFVIHPGTRHGYADLQASTIVFNCLYKPANPPSSVWELPSIVRSIFFPDKNCQRAETFTGTLSGKDFEHAIMLVKMIQAGSKCRRPFARELEALHFSGLLLLLSREQSSNSETKHAVIRAELEYIAKHANQRITLKELCAVSGRSPATLNRLFRNEVGKSPYAYALNYRLNKARSLLSEQRLALSSVAYETGFFDTSHLSRALQLP